jgi:LPXTG-motif cell wall-anchored protein
MGRKFACALLISVFALPGVAFGQSAGDEQYEDPFAPTEEPAQEPEAPAEPEPAAEPAPAPAQAAPEPAPATTAQAPNGGEQQLPRTGADEGLVALAGVVMLAGGIALRVRTR